MDYVAGFVKIYFSEEFSDLKFQHFFLLLNQIKSIDFPSLYYGITIHYIWIFIVLSCYPTNILGLHGYISTIHIVRSGNVARCCFNVLAGRKVWSASDEEGSYKKPLK